MDARVPVGGIPTKNEHCRRVGPPGWATGMPAARPRPRPASEARLRTCGRACRAAPPPPEPGRVQAGGGATAVALRTRTRKLAILKRMAASLRTARQLSGLRTQRVARPRTPGLKWSCEGPSCARLPIPPQSPRSAVKTLYRDARPTHRDPRPRVLPASPPRAPLRDPPFDPRRVPVSTVRTGRRS